MLRRAFNALVVLLLVPAPGRGEHLPSRLFTTADGLSHNVVTRIVTDSRGYQWFCTREGLSRFDGSRFVTYGIEEGLPSDEVNDVLESRDGTYWVATRRGLVRFNPMGIPRRDAAEPMFSIVSAAESTPPLAVTTLLEDRDGHLWVGTLRGLHRLTVDKQGAHLAPVDLDVDAEIVSLAVHARDGLWVGTSGGLFRLFGDGRRKRYSLPGLPEPFISSLLADAEGRLWVGSRNGGLALVTTSERTDEPQLIRVFTEEDGLGSSWINQLLLKSDGELWVATSAGLVRMRSDAATGRCAPCADAIGVGVNAEVLALSEDRTRNVWVGTGIGAKRLLTAGFVLFSADDGIPAGSSLIETSGGTLLSMTAGTTRDGAVWFDGSRFVSTRLPVSVAETSWGWNQLMLESRYGEWWIGTRSGALRLRGVRAITDLQRASEQRRFSRTDGLAANVVLRLFEDSRGDVWIGTVGEGKGNGLSRWERSTNTLHHYQSAHGLPDLTRHFVTSFAEDHSGAMWIGFSDDAGLARVRGTAIDPLVEKDLGPVGTVHNLLVSADGTLWVATTRGGVLRVGTPSAERPAISRLTIADGLSSNDIGAVVEDVAGNIYAGTARGIDRIDRTSRRILRYGAADGLPVGEVLAAIRDRQGALWFGYKVGIVRFVPTNKPSPPVPSVVIDGLAINNRDQHLSALGQADIAPFELPPGRTAVQVRYVAPGLGPMEHVRYEIRLDGVDRDWSQPSEQRTVSYANIGPGRYRFAVRALAADGTVSSNTAGFEFRVLAPLWQRWWFVSTALVLAAAAGYGVNRYRISRVLQLANVRARIARDLHDDIGANFTRIAVLAEVARRQGGSPPGAEVPLTSIATVARESVTAMGEIVWAVNPERDRVNDLTRRMREYAEEVFVTGEVAVTFIVPDGLKELRLGVEVRRDVYLVFKEAANNAARHSGCSDFRVALSRNRRWLTIAIEDNGLGFDEPDSERNGLSNMRRRAELLGGRISIASAVGRGTIVTLAVPLATGSRLFG